MNYHPVGFLRAVCGAVLLGGFAVVGATQEKAAAPMPAPGSGLKGAPTSEELAQRGKEMLAKVIAWEATVKLELRAIGEVGGVPVAMIDVEGEPQMMTKNSGIMGLHISEIDGATQTATVVDRAGNARVLPLTNARDIKFPQVEAKRFLTAEALARWRGFPAENYLPGAVVQAWPKINREGKEDILLNYLRGGTVVTLISGPSGGVNTSIGFLFSEQEQQLRKERRDRFLASLTPEQRDAFGNGAQPAIRFTDPPADRERQAAKAKEAKERMDKVIAGLTPEQKALYEEYIPTAQSRPMGH